MRMKNLGRTLALFTAMTLVSACGGGGSTTVPLGPGAAGPYTGHD